MRATEIFIENAPAKDAEAFVLAKWKERAKEMGRPEPHDLTGACKFAALFAQAIFGGTLMANELHTWVDLNGKVLDLSANAADAREMKAGKIPESMKSYAQAYGITLPKTGIYTPDPRFMRSKDFKESLASNKPRVERWVAEFKAPKLTEDDQKHIYTRRELEQMDIDDLDRMAFGVASGDIIDIDPRKIRTKYHGDLLNPEAKFAKNGMDWVRSVDFSEPVEVSVNNKGQFELEDGHHRRFAAIKLRKPTIKAIIDVRGKPIEMILARQAKEQANAGS